jgi:ectoine hydroxylase-related dioxygenase (phytanoyl-CoA dioxygenase family)
MTVHISDLTTMYRRDGYVIAQDVFPRNALARVAEAMRATLDKGHFPAAHFPAPASLEEVIQEREAEDHALVYNAANSIGSSAGTYQLIGGSRILDVVADLIQVNVSDLHLMPMYLIVQLPSDERFDYVWHQDGAYYEWCTELVTLWFPINHEATPEKGTISVIDSSHSAGLRAAETYKRHGFFRQIEVAAGEQAGQEKPLSVALGDCCIMHGHTLHRSVANRSSVPRVTGVLRLANMARQDKYDREQFYCMHKS